MKFCWVTISVKDMDESLKFYQGLLGLNIHEKFISGDSEIAMLGEADKPKVELICNMVDRAAARTAGLSVGFLTDSLDDAIGYMKKNNISIKKGPFSPSPSVSFFYIEDPNGVEIQIVERKTATSGK